MLWAIVAIIAVAVLYIILIYNRLIVQRNLVNEAYSGIDVQLKQRSSLIPNLVETVKGYIGHESSVLEKVTELRSKCLQSGSVEDRSANENLLTGALRQLFAVSENYPDLKASQNFIDLQHSLQSIEEQIQLARRYYNGSVRNLNITIQSFPSNLIAKQFNAQPAVFFQTDNEDDRKVPNVKFS